MLLLAPVVGAALIAGAAAIGSAFLGNKYAKENMEDQQDYGEYMFKHRYQMQMKDMWMAGLNPMLAAGATPPGPPSPGSASTQGPDLLGAVSTATQMQRTASEIETQEKQRDLMATEGAKNLTQTDLNSQQARESQVRQAKILEETAKIREETKSASAKAYQDSADATRRNLIGPKTWYTDAAEAVVRTGQGFKSIGADVLKRLGLLSETPKREAEREAEPVPAPAQPRYKGRSGR